MTDHINLRCTLYPLLRTENGYFCSNKCCCAIADVESGNQPLSHARSGNLNNMEAQLLDNRNTYLMNGKLSGLKQGAASVAPKVKGR